MFCVLFPFFWCIASANRQQQQYCRAVLDNTQHARTHGSGGGCGGCIITTNTQRAQKELWQIYLLNLFFCLIAAFIAHAKHNTLSSLSVFFDSLAINLFCLCLCFVLFSSVYLAAYIAKRLCIGSVPLIYCIHF